MSHPDWRSDLEGLLDEKALKALYDLIHKRKKRRALAIRLLYVFLAFAFLGTIAGVWTLTDWKNSIRADIANGVVALGLALSTLLARALPTISKEEVDRTVGTSILRPTFARIEAQVGGGERLQQWIALFAAAVLFAVILLKSFVPDT